jgi:elongation factor Ts
MAAITASQVKDLREKTGVGMMECKKALEENGGDMEKSIVWLRERGMSRAAKKADRVAAEGVVEVFVTPDQTTGVLVELNCETDFVAKNDEFLKLAKDIAQVALQKKAASNEEILGASVGGETIQNRLTALIAKIGENMTLRRTKILTSANGVVAGYSHMGGKIGTLVVLEGAKGPEVAEVAKDLAMHVAAAAPRYMLSNEVDTAELDQEKEIARKKLLEEGKKPEMIDKILVGQMNKFYKEVCLVEQAFVKDPALTVQKHVDNANKGLKIAAFARFQLGEGIEKKKENFADEVAAQMNR